MKVSNAFKRTTTVAAVAILVGATTLVAVAASRNSSRHPEAAARCTKKCGKHDLQCTKEAPHMLYGHECPKGHEFD